MRLCSASLSFSKRRSKSLDDRPFSSDTDSLVYPQHHLYDRVILPCRWDGGTELKTGRKADRQENSDSYDPFCLAEPVYSDPSLADDNGTDHQPPPAR